MAFAPVDDGAQIFYDDDQIVPFDVSGRISSEIVPNAQLIVYEGGAHGLPDTERERLHADMLAFIESNNRT
jgi:non-heme chloroperoxidase